MLGSKASLCFLSSLHATRWTSRVQENIGDILGQEQHRQCTNSCLLSHLTVLQLSTGHQLPTTEDGEGPHYSCLTLGAACHGCDGTAAPTSDGKWYIVIFIDCFSQYVIAVPMANHKVSTITQLLQQNIILVFRIPGAILSNWGIEFTSHLWDYLDKMFGYRLI